MPRDPIYFQTTWPQLLSLNNKNIAGYFLVLQIYPMLGESHSPQLNVGSELFALQKDF